MSDLWNFHHPKKISKPTIVDAKNFELKIFESILVWYDAVVQKVTPTLVQVFYPEDNETKRHNLLVSGITKKRLKPLGDYMAKGVRWKIKK